jgi:hypothetical protein
VLPLLGCGPVQYYGQVSGNAATALAQAEHESASQLAPYEYTKARAYYDKSREEAGRSSFETAIDYGRRAEVLALRARVVARERSQPPPPAPSPSAPSLPEAPSLPDRPPARPAPGAGEGP